VVGAEGAGGKVQGRLEQRTSDVELSHAEGVDSSHVEKPEVSSGTAPS